MIKMDLSKIFLELYDKNVEVDVIINSILVYENIRKSFLLELHSKKYDATLQIIKQTFKNLKFIILKSKIEPLYNIYGTLITQPETFDNIYGTLITKNGTEIPSAYITEEKDVYDITNMSDSKDLGEFLSYPCAGDDMKQKGYVFRMNVNYDNEKYYLISMICSKNKMLTPLKNFINKITKCMKLINIDLKNPIKIKISFEKMYTVNEIINNYLSGKKNKTLTHHILDVLSVNGFILIKLLYNDNVFDIYDKKMIPTITTFINICIMENTECTSVFYNYEQYIENIKQNVCKYTTLIINIFNNMYGIKIDGDKYFPSIQNITNEMISNLK